MTDNKNDLNKKNLEVFKEQLKKEGISLQLI